MRISQFLDRAGSLEAGADELLMCASCGTVILVLLASDHPLSIERLRWPDGRTAAGGEEIVCPQCGSRSPLARPRAIARQRKPLTAGYR